MKTKTVVEVINLNIHLYSLANATGDFKELLNGDDNTPIFRQMYTMLEVETLYPMKNPFTFHVYNARHIADVLVPAAKLYKDELFGSVLRDYDDMIGSIEDLYFGRITIYNDGTCFLDFLMPFSKEREKYE